MSTLTHRRSQRNLPLVKPVAELFCRSETKTQLYWNHLCLFMTKQALQQASGL